MEENSKKRSRKSKLVPRECLDSDDENIAVMQEEIEATLVSIKNKSILKKLNSVPVSMPLEFSIKVEVEEFNETCEDNLNIKIDSIKSLSDSIVSPAPVSSKEPKTLGYTFTEEKLRNEIEKLSQETTDYADKQIEIYLRNYFGKNREHLLFNRVDQILQHIFRKKWKNWRNTFPKIREMPLMYKCYTCNKAWWYLYDFREHVLKHDDSFVIDLETNFHECHLIAYQGTTPAKRNLWVDGNCWRCGSNTTPHWSEYDRNVGYKCSGCMEKFYTCALLNNHTNTCLVYKKTIMETGKEVNENFPCTQCQVKCGSQSELLEHMVLSHSVRSDIPVDWSLRTCSKCDFPFHLQALHDCIYKTSTTSCEFCLRKFKSHLFVSIHLNAAQDMYLCRICGIQLSKQCMEFEHLMDHTNNYTMLYKCIYCPDLMLFPSVAAVNKHKSNCHAKVIENRNMSGCYEMIAAPKRFIENYKKDKHIESDNEETESLPAGSERSFDTARHLVMGFLDNDKKRNEVNLNDVFEKTSKPKSDIKKKLTTDMTPKVPTSIRKHSVEISKIVDDTRNLDIKTHRTKKSDTGSHHIKKTDVIHEKNVNNPSILNVEISNLIGKKKDASLKTKSKRARKVYEKRCRQQKSNKSKEILTDDPTTIEIPASTQGAEAERLDHHLIIKQEILEDYELNDYGQPKGACEIEIENAVNIKQEVGVRSHDPGGTVADSQCNNLNDNSDGNKTNHHAIEAYNVLIKEEVVDEDVCDNDYVLEECEEQINFQIKEESLDELCEDDMIILDPSNGDAPMNGFSLKLSAQEASVPPDDVDMRNLEPEVIVYQSYGKKKYKCRKCSFEGLHHQYKIHIQEEGHHSTKMKCLRKAGLPKTSDKGNYNCTKCNVTYPTFYKYILHFNKEHEYKTLTCPKCFRPVPNVQILHSHMNTHIKENFVSIYLIKTTDTKHNTHQCKICSEKLTTSDFFSHWESHLELSKDHASWKGFLPEMENKHELKRMLLLLQGLETPNSEEGPQQKLRRCLKCKRRFERKNECKRHFIEHLLVDAYQDRHKSGFLKCQICAQQFFTGERYKRHMRDHASLPLYKCELCDKAFSDSSNFTKHKKVHNLSVLICDICNKKFTGKPYLEKHMQMHQMTKPMVCNECNKVFYTESSYKKHLSRGLIRFRCPSCNIFFNCLRDKWDHMWEVHKERKFLADCPLCKKSFRKHQDVRLHIKMDHREVKYKYVPNKMEINDHCRSRKNVNSDELVAVYTN